MSDTTNQMSLLDAIGFNEPEEKKTKKDSADAGAETAAPVAQIATAQITEAPEAAEAELAKSEYKTGDTADETVAPTDAIGTLEIQPDGPLPLDKYLCFALYSANHAMHSVYKALLKEVGLTYPQFLAMTVLWDKNNVPVGAITQKLQLDTNTLTPLLKRLEAMGLLTRTRSTKDERQVILKLTRKGRSLQKKTEHFGSCVFTSTGMSLEEVVDLQNKIMKLRDNLRDADLT